MTDDVAIVQHAVLDVPNRRCGYCTDDVGRALIVACAARDARLVRTYLSYLHDAQLADGWFHGFLSYDRRWQDDAATPDAVGRALWGLGYAERHASRDTWRAVAAKLRRAALPVVPRLGYLRSHAYAALGLTHVLAGAPADAVAVRAALDQSLTFIADAFDANAGPEWDWCEPVITYDNARLPEALLRGGTALQNERYLRTGLAMLEFYAGVTIEQAPDRSGSIFVPVGCAGWYPRGGEKSREGQQPLEAAAFVEAALAASEITGEGRWDELAEIAHAWYFGRNTHGIVLAADGGCRDGFGSAGLNPNMGAESSICFALSAIALANRSSSALRVVR